MTDPDAPIPARGLPLSARAPGKCIVFGEHAVVHGAPELLFAVDLYTQVFVRAAQVTRLNADPEASSRNGYFHAALELGWPAGPPVDVRAVSRIPRAAGLGSSAAFASALAATREAKLATERGHLLPHGAALPYVLDDPVEELRTAKDARTILEHLKLWPDVRRAQDGTHLHGSGRARRRGRVRRTPRSLLVVTAAAGKARGFRNLAGVDVVPVGRLGTEDLAPGGVAGRLTIYSRAAVEMLRSRLGEAAA